VGENATSDDGHGDTRVTTEIQAPPVAGTAPTRVDTPRVTASPDPLAAAAAGPAERGRLRRRLRKLKALRAKQHLELGTLVFDARKRSNGSRPEVVDRRSAEVAEIERQVRELQHAVDAHADTRELATGVSGSCDACGTLLSTEDRFCPSCGAPTKPGRVRPADTAPVAPKPAVAAKPAAPPMPAGTAAAPPPPPPPADAPLAHADRGAIPPPPPPPL